MANRTAPVDPALGRFLVGGTLGGSTIEIVEPPEPIDPLPQTHLLSLGDQLVLTGSGVYTTTDGQEWDEIGRLPTGTDWMPTAAGDHVLIHQDKSISGPGLEDNDTVFVLEPSGELTTVDVPDEIAELGGFLPNDSTVWITAFSPSSGPDPDTWEEWLVGTDDGARWFTVDVADHTGYTGVGQEHRFEGIVNNGLVVYEAVDGWHIVALP